ncbi:MAG: hypothetical protein ACR2GN_10785, partial [Bacteroidia bacterium]
IFSVRSSKYFIKEDEDLPAPIINIFFIQDKSKKWFNNPIRCSYCFVFNENRINLQSEMV